MNKPLWKYVLGWASAIAALGLGLALAGCDDPSIHKPYRVTCQIGDKAITFEPATNLRSGSVWFSFDYRGSSLLVTPNKSCMAVPIPAQTNWVQPLVDPPEHPDTVIK